MFENKKITCLLLLVLTQSLLLTGPISADESIGPEWWTLTDSLTPAELKAIHENPDLHRERYLDAVREGVRDALPEKRTQRINSFFTGELTPELFPMWLAFNGLSVNLYEADSSELNEKTDWLLSAGFDPSLAERIVQVAVENLEESTSLGRELHESAWAFALVLAEARSKLGRPVVDQAVKENKLNQIALATSRDSAELASLKAVWERDPIKEVNVETITRLRSELTEEQWQRLRAFLLERIAPMISTLDFAEEEAQ